MQEDNKPYPIPTILYCNWHGGSSCHIIGPTLSRALDKELYACEAALSLLEARGRATPPNDVRGREQTVKHATLDKLTAEIK